MASRWCSQQLRVDGAYRATEEDAFALARVVAKVVLREVIERTGKILDEEDFALASHTDSDALEQCAYLNGICVSITVAENLASELFAEEPSQENARG
jgi:hypothetical protein